MSAAGSGGFVAWLLAAVGGAMDAGGISPDAAGSVRAELAKFAGAGSVQVVRACRNGGRVDAMLAGQAGPRWAVVAGLDGQDRVTSLWVQREPAVFAGAPDTGAVDPQRAAALVLAALADGKARTR